MRFEKNVFSGNPVDCGNTYFFERNGSRNFDDKPLL